MFKRLDIKTIFILILGISLILSIVFRPSNDIETHEDELDKLRIDNIRLVSSNDSLIISNNKLEDDVSILQTSIDSLQVKIDSTNNKIKDLEDGKGKISGYVNGLDAKGISSSLSDYLNRQ